MHRRQLLLIHTVLSLAAVLLAFRLAGEWRRANLRYAALERQTEEAPADLSPSRLERPTPPIGEIVAKNLFSPDRSNQIAEPETAPAPLALPVVFGTMNLGEGYEALMAESREGAAGKFRRVKVGESVGAYTVVEIQDEKVVMEMAGQRTTLDVYQSARSVPPQRTRSVPPASPVVETVESPRPAGPRQPGSAQTPASQSPGPGVRVTIEGNRRRFERQTMFGPQVWYENIEP